MTTYKKLLKHQGGLIKVFDPIVRISINSDVVVEPNCPLLYLGLSEHQNSYRIYQKHVVGEVKSIIPRTTVRLLINGQIYDTSIYLPRVWLL